MKLTKFIFLLLYLMPLSTWAASNTPVAAYLTPDLSAYPKDSEGRAYVDGQVLVHFDKDLPESTRESLVTGMGFEFSKLLYFDGLVIKVPVGTVLNNVEKLKTNSSFKYVYPNYIPQLLSYAPYPYPNDPNYQNGSDEWNVNAVHMDQAWNSTDPWIANASLGRPSAVIAIIDSGIRVTHEEFAGKLWVNPSPTMGDINGWNFVDNNNNLNDGYEHGTSVSGTASSDTNNGKGGGGICANCSLMVLKAFSDTGAGGDIWIDQSYMYAIQNGAKAINASYGGAFPDLDQYYTDLAFNSGSLVIGAMGNGGSNIQNSPAGDPNAIGVGSIDSSGTRCSYSDFGSWIGLVAPVCNSVFTPSFSCDTCYAFYNGTSMAAPQVSAMAAILLDLGLSPAATKQDLFTTADDLGSPGFDNQTGWGQMNCYRALAAIRPASTLSSSGGANQVSLNWVAPITTAFSTTDYIISRSTTPGGPYSMVGQTPNGLTLSFADTSPNPNITYYYVVQAVDAKGNTTVVSNESSAMATGATFTPTATITATVTSTPTPNYGDMSGFTYQGLWHPVNDLTSPCPNSYTPPWAAYYGIDSQCNFDSGNTNPSTLVMPSSLVTGSGDLTFWIWLDTGPNGIIFSVETSPVGCGGIISLGALPQKTWIPMNVICGVTDYFFVAQAVSATGNTGRGIYIDAVKIGAPIPTFTLTPTGTLPPTVSPTPTFNEFVGTPTNPFTPTNTPTLTDSMTPTASPTATSTASPTLTLTLTPTATPTDTPCGFPGNTCAPSLTSTPTLDPSVLIHDHRPYPNPVTGSEVTFWYQLSVPVDKVGFKLFTVASRKVAAFAGTTQAGNNSVSFDTSEFANGFYYYVIEASGGGKTEHKVGKLLIIR